MNAPGKSPITAKKLKMVEVAEEFLSDHGFKQFRVRHHGPVARIEVEPSEIERITGETFREKLVEKFKEIGFIHISVDLEGYVSGSMNRVLENSFTLIESKPD